MVDHEGGGWGKTLIGALYMYVYINYTLLYSGHVVMKAFIYVRRLETESQTKIHLKIASADEFKYTMDSQL